MTKVAQLPEQNILAGATFVQMNKKFPVVLRCLHCQQYFIIHLNKSYYAKDILLQQQQHCHNNFFSNFFAQFSELNVGQMHFAKQQGQQSALSRTPVQIRIYLGYNFGTYLSYIIFFPKIRKRERKNSPDSKIFFSLFD